MNRYDRIAATMEDEVNEVVLEMSNLANMHTDYGAMVLSGKPAVMTDGDKVTIHCTLYFDKLVYLGSYVGSRIVRKHDEPVVIRAFQEALKDLHGAIVRQITTKLERDVPMYSIVGWREADDYEGVQGKVQSVDFGNKVTIKFDEVMVNGRVSMVIQARKLPELSEGIYDQMSDRELAQVVARWANAAPENFWMDGEYRGTAAQRTRDLMRQWRGMTPHKQQKHYDDLMRWV